VRAWLLEGRKKELGDPPVEPPAHNRGLMKRVQFLLRIESLINVGCTFRPDDLPPRVWDELIAMALERQFVDRLVDRRRSNQRSQDQAVNAARRQTGLPPPGSTIFQHSKPFRGSTT
jgi:hypothetical protein